MTRPYSKPALSYSDQIALLESRHMGIADKTVALFSLQHLNYYRLRAYWIPFEIDSHSHTLRQGTTIESVLRLYEFDRRLRRLVIEALERIEVSIRSNLAYQMAIRYGSHCHLDSSIAASRSRWQNNLDKLEEECLRSKEAFITHHANTYQEPLPPIWVCCEVMSLGLLSRLYSNIKCVRTKKAIASIYGVNEVLLKSWLHHLTHIRNYSAHHCRLWNREFTVTPAEPRTQSSSLSRLKTSWNSNTRRFYNTILILDYLVASINPDHSISKDFLDLVQEFNIDGNLMGFPVDWQKLPWWN